MTTDIGPRKSEPARLEVPEAEYKADLELLTKYQAFSSELLRISLLGLSVFGVLLNRGLLSDDIKYFVLVSIASFGLCSGLSLFHRYYSTEGLMYHVLLLRRPGSERAAELRNKMYRRSAIGMALASVLAGIAAVLLCVGFIKAAF